MRNPYRKKVREIMRQKGIDIPELARRLGITPAKVEPLLNARRPKGKSIKAMADALEVNVSALGFGPVVTAMARKGWSPIHLGKALGKCPTATGALIKRVESGQSCRTDSIVRLSRVLEVPVEDLIANYKPE